MEYLLLIIGFVLLIKGADFFVDGSSSLARFLKIPSVIIGLTIVAMGTSAPEASVSINAALAGNNDIAVSNVIGSNIFNGLVVVGICAFISAFKTNKDILKRDIESILPYCGNMDDIERHLVSLGYQFPRNRDYKHISIIAPGRKRAIRLDSLGYTNDVLCKRIYENRSRERFYVLRNSNPPFRPKAYPLLILEKKLNYEITHSKDTAVVLVDVLFYILLQLLNLTRDEQELQRRNQPLSPSIRQSLTIENKLLSEYAFLKSNDLHSTEDILNFMDSRTAEIASLEAERQKIRNSNRRPKSNEERQAKNTAARELSKKLKSLRKELKLAESALERYPQVWELLKTERDAEMKSRNRKLERGR